MPGDYRNVKTILDAAHAVEYGGKRANRSHLRAIIEHLSNEDMLLTDTQRRLIEFEARRSMPSDQMLLSAVRYALGRSNYIVGDTCDEVRRCWPNVGANIRFCIERDVREAIERAEQNGSTVGMDIDHEEWVGLLGWIEQQRHAAVAP